LIFARNLEKMKNIILLAIVLSCGFLVHGQDFVDNALLFSRTRPNGSARIQAIGGAQTAIGGDYSSALSNPAGLGMFNRSEFTITPALTFSNTTSTYFGTKSTDSKSIVNFPGLSLTLHRPSGRDRGFIGGTFGITMTRTNDLNLDYRYAGRNNENSIIDYFINDAGDIDPNELLFNGSYFYSLTGLAYNNYLIEDRSDQNGFYYDSKLLFNSANQEEVSERQGAQYQWSIAYGANFNDQIFIGANIGIASIRYKLSQSYFENQLEYPTGTAPLSDFSLNETYDIRGSGVNLTLGAIYRPVDAIQIGASFTTPTSYLITDNYTASMRSQWNNFDYFPDVTDDDNLNSVSEEFDEPLVSEYRLVTPMRVSGGATFISEAGFITADVEFVNYSNSKYRPITEGNFDPENDDIKAEFKPTVNYRIGGEYRLKAYRFRGGLNYMPEPLQAESDVNRSILTYSVGAGYRVKNFYVDFAAVFGNTQGIRRPYSVPGEDPVASQKFRSSNFMLTFGFPF
jgi:hypothetical protein